MTATTTNPIFARPFVGLLAAVMAFGRTTKFVMMATMTKTTDAAVCADLESVAMASFKKAKPATTATLRTTMAARVYVRHRVAAMAW